MLLDMLMQPRKVIIILLFHESFFYDNSEYICNDTNGYENVAIEVHLSEHGIYLDEVVVSVPDHITMHQREQSIATHTEICKSSALPEDSHSEEAVADEQRDHTDQCSRNIRSRLDETCKHTLVSLCLEEVSEHSPPRKHAAKAQVSVSSLDIQLLLSED